MLAFSGAVPSRYHRPTPQHHDTIAAASRGTYALEAMSTSEPVTTQPKRRRLTSYRSYLRSGHYAKGTALIPAADSPVGTILAERRQALIADLGGQESCSTAMLAMLDLVVQSWAQLDSVDGYLLTSRAWSTGVTGAAGRWWPTGAVSHPSSRACCGTSGSSAA